MFVEDQAAESDEGGGGGGEDEDDDDESLDEYEQDGFVVQDEDVSTPSLFF